MLAICLTVPPRSTLLLRASPQSRLRFKLLQSLCALVAAAHEDRASSKKARVSKTCPKKRIAKVPKMGVNHGSGQAQRAGPTSPSRQMYARDAGRPRRYNEVSSSCHLTRSAPESVKPVIYCQ